ncbi:hypothetical protein [Mycobacterium sp. NAZ190054]|uniref:hypothetical protein n=1 Tax=Mycobacterium sp. NAZ190054 TaxID=1747766 RepID=UPI0012E3CA57|nr:hypothetical protein [Mycobacterium sp. NAZ190054]
MRRRAGGAVVGRVGRGVENSGSVCSSGARVAVPSTDDWQPASAAAHTSTVPATATWNLITSSVRSLWRK